MTSRERVHRLFRGELKDSFAISAGGTPNDSMSAIAYANLLKHLEITDAPIKIYDLFQFLPLLDDRVVSRMGSDFVHAERPRFRFNLHRGNWKPGTLPDGVPCLYPEEFNPIPDAHGGNYVEMDGERYAHMPKGGFYYDIIRHPLCDAMEPADLKLVHPATYMSEEDVEATAREVEDRYFTTDKAVVLLFGGYQIEQAQRDFGFEEFYCNMAEEPELMHAYFRMITDSYMDSLARILKRCGDKLDVVWFADDVGTQQTLQISIRMFRELVKPYKKEMMQYIHEYYPHIKVLYHSCGAIFDVIPDFIDMGVDMLNPVQISAKGMDPQRLKDTYGQDIIFWGGGTNTQGLRPGDDPEKLADEAQRLLEIFSKGGNYVFTQVHNFQADTRPEQILEIFDRARRLRAEREALK